MAVVEVNSYEGQMEKVRSAIYNIPIYVHDTTNTLPRTSNTSDAVLLE